MCQISEQKISNDCRQKMSNGRARNKVAIRPTLGPKIIFPSKKKLAYP
jgi:hypothetical protein